MNKKQTDKNLVADLIERNSNRIMMLCRGYCNNKEDLEDLFQEVSINILKGFSSFRGDSSESTWIYRITINTALNFNRSEKKRVSTVPILNIDVVDSSMGTNAPAQRLYSLIMKLDVAERALVMLWLENLSYQDISLIMGISVKNVSVKMVRIKEKLKKLAKEE